MSRFPPLVVVLLALAALAVLCVGTGAPAIQANVRECTQTRLQEAGLFGLVTEVDGRDVALSGPGAVSSVEAQARQVALGCGARVVGGDWGTAPTGPYTTTLCLEPGRVSFAGSVPDAEVGRTVREDLANRLGGSTLDGEVSVRMGGPVGYAQMLERAAREVTQLEAGCVELQGEAVRVSGAIRSQAALDGLMERFEASAGSDFRVSYDLDVPDLSESARACQAAYDEMLGAGARVLFDFDSSDLHQEGRALLDTVEGIWAQQCPDVSIVVTGHTDNVGEPGYNRALSLERAQAVAAYLVQQGFDPDKLTALGYGETQPRADNDTEEGRAQNRRIEFRIRETER